MNARTIWHHAQNRPSLVVRDLAEYAPADVVYETLLRRGVFEWLAVRRDLIRLKDRWGNWGERARCAHQRAGDEWEERHTGEPRGCGGGGVMRIVARFWEPVDEDIDELCHYCQGEKWGIVGVHWDSDDPINGPYDGEIEPCPCCGGSGLAKDCVFW